MSQSQNRTGRADTAPFVRRTPRRAVMWRSPARRHPVDACDLEAVLLPRPRSARTAPRDVGDMLLEGEGRDLHRVVAQSRRRWRTAPPAGSPGDLVADGELHPWHLAFGGSLRLGATLRFPVDASSGHGRRREPWGSCGRLLRPCRGQPHGRPGATPPQGLDGLLALRSRSLPSGAPAGAGTGRRRHQASPRKRLGEGGPVPRSIISRRKATSSGNSSKAITASSGQMSVDCAKPKPRLDASRGQLRALVQQAAGQLPDLRQ